MFAHKEISDKFCGPTRSGNAQHVLMRVYSERFATERKKKKKPEFQLRKFPRKARVITEYQRFCLWFWEVKSANICSSFSSSSFFFFFLLSFKIMMRLMVNFPSPNIYLSLNIFFVVVYFLFFDTI